MDRRIKIQAWFVEGSTQYVNSTAQQPLLGTFLGEGTSSQWAVNPVVRYAKREKWPDM